MSQMTFTRHPFGSIAYESVKQTTPPSAYPITVDEVKQQCRILNDAEDGVIERYLQTAVRYIEKQARRQFITATFTLKLDEFPAGNAAIHLPYAPLISVTSITYTDTAGTSQTWSSGDYTVDTNSEPGRVFPAYLETYPDTRDVQNAVVIVYTAGYGSSGSSVPIEARQAMLHLAAHWFENREPVNIGNIVTPLPMHVESLIALVTVPEVR